VALIPQIGNYIQDGGGKRIQACGLAHGGADGPVTAANARACCMRR
jgi:hypothetical protein